MHFQAYVLPTRPSEPHGLLQFMTHSNISKQWLQVVWSSKFNKAEFENYAGVCPMWHKTLPMITYNYCVKVMTKHYQSSCYHKEIQSTKPGQSRCFGGSGIWSYFLHQKGMNSWWYHTVFMHRRCGHTCYTSLEIRTRLKQGRDCTLGALLHDCKQSLKVCIHRLLCTENKRMVPALHTPYVPWEVSFCGILLVRRTTGSKSLQDVGAQEKILMQSPQPCCLKCLNVCKNVHAPSVVNITRHLGCEPAQQFFFLEAHASHRRSLPEVHCLQHAYSGGNGEEHFEAGFVVNKKSLIAAS